jgi:hypothetical protein
MSFANGLTRFWAPLFRFTDPSQKRPFLRGDSGDANILNCAHTLVGPREKGKHSEHACIWQTGGSDTMLF